MFSIRFYSVWVKIGKWKLCAKFSMEREPEKLFYEEINFTSKVLDSCGCSLNDLGLGSSFLVLLTFWWWIAFNSIKYLHHLSWFLLQNPLLDYALVLFIIQLLDRISHICVSGHVMLEKVNVKEVRQAANLAKLWRVDPQMIVMEKAMYHPFIVHHTQMRVFVVYTLITWRQIAPWPAARGKRVG